MPSFDEYNWVTSISSGDRVYRGMLRSELYGWIQQSKVPKGKSFSPQLFWAAQYADMYSRKGPVVLIGIKVEDSKEWTFEPSLGCGPSEVRCLVDLELGAVQLYDHDDVLNRLSHPF